MIRIGPYLPWTYAEYEYIIRFCPEAMSLELGLRWLNDRSAESRYRAKSRRWQDPSGRWFGNGPPKDFIECPLHPKHDARFCGLCND